MFVKPVNDQILRVPLVANWAVNCYLVKDADDSLVLIDTGIKGSYKKLEKALKVIGKSFSDIKAVVVSHAHLDHVGSLDAVKKNSKSVVYCHDSEKEYITQGKNPPVDPSFLTAKVFSFFSTAPRAIGVDYTFKDGDVLDLAGGLLVIHTPGHTPGHCSFIHQPTNTLITGDAIVNFFSRLNYPFKFFCSNYKLTKETAKKLSEIDYEAAVFMHGPPILKDARETIGKFLEVV